MTKEQYEFFKSQYDEENIRNTELTKRAEIYLSIISLFLTAVLFKIKDVFDIIEDNPNVILLTSLLVLGLLGFSTALVFIINSLRIRDYEGVIDYDSYVAKNNDNFQSNKDFFEDRVADYIVAVERNEEINNQKAKLLINARVGILCGFLITVIFIISLLIIKNMYYAKL